MASGPDLSQRKASCTCYPDFAVCCFFIEKFGEFLGLLKLNIKNLQEGFEDSSDEVPDLISELHIYLLRRLKKNVPVDRWERQLIQFCFTYNHWHAWELEEVGYANLKLSTKLSIIRNLLEAQLDGNIRFQERIRAEIPEEDLRLPCYGRDRDGLCYWLIQDEEYTVNVYRVEQDDTDGSSWQVVAKDRDDLCQLIECLKESKPIPGLLSLYTESRSDTPVSTLSGITTGLNKSRTNTPSGLTANTPIKEPSDIDSKSSIRSKLFSDEPIKMETDTSEKPVGETKREGAYSEVIRQQQSKDNLNSNEIIRKEAIKQEVDDEIKADVKDCHSERCNESTLNADSHVEEKKDDILTNKSISEPSNSDLVTAKSIPDDTSKNDNMVTEDQPVENSESFNALEDKNKQLARDTEKPQCEAKQKEMDMDEPTNGKFEGESIARVENSDEIREQFQGVKCEEDSKAECNELQSQSEECGELKLKKPGGQTDKLDEKIYNSDSNADKLEEQTDKSKGRTDTLDGQADKPDGQTDETDGQTNKPDGQTNETDGQTNKPDGQTDETDGQTNKSDGHTDKPEGQTDKLAGQTDKPDGQTDKPDDEFKAAEEVSSRTECEGKSLDSQEQDGRLVEETDIPVAATNNEVKPAMSASDSEDNIPLSELKRSCILMSQARKSLMKAKKQHEKKKFKEMMKKKKQKMKKQGKGSSKAEQTSSSSAPTRSSGRQRKPVFSNVQSDDEQCNTSDFLSDDDYVPKGRNARRQAKRSGFVVTTTDVLSSEVDNDDTPCASCGNYTQPHLILLCDKCDSGWHTACVKPALFYIPEGDWYCPTCEHSILIEKLEAHLVSLDAQIKAHEAKMRRLERQEKYALANGINPENILDAQPVTKRSHRDRRNNRADEYEYDSWEEDFGYSQNKRSCRTRAKINYRYDEYESMMSSAIRGNEEADPTILPGTNSALISSTVGSSTRTRRPPAGQSRGKDISNLLGEAGLDLSSEEDTKKDESKDETSPEMKKPEKPVKKKQRKRFNVDASGSDSTDADYSLSEEQYEEEAPEEVSEESLSDDAWVPGGRSKRARRSQARRRSLSDMKRFICDDDEDSETDRKRKSARRQTRTSAAAAQAAIRSKRMNFGFTSSDESLATTPCSSSSDDEERSEQTRGKWKTTNTYSNRSAARESSDSKNKPNNTKKKKKRKRIAAAYNSDQSTEKEEEESDSSGEEYVPVDKQAGRSEDGDEEGSRRVNNRLESSSDEETNNAESTQDASANAAAENSKPSDADTCQDTNAAAEKKTDEEGRENKGVHAVKQELDESKLDMETKIDSTAKRPETDASGGNKNNNSNNNTLHRPSSKDSPLARGDSKQTLMDITHKNPVANPMSQANPDAMGEYSKLGSRKPPQISEQVIQRPPLAVTSQIAYKTEQHRNSSPNIVRPIASWSNHNNTNRMESVSHMAYMKPSVNTSYSYPVGGQSAGSISSHPYPIRPIASAPVPATVSSVPPHPVAQYSAHYQHSNYSQLPPRLPHLNQTYLRSPGGPPPMPHHSLPSNMQVPMSNGQSFHRPASNMGMWSQYPPAVPLTNQPMNFNPTSYHAPVSQTPAGSAFSQTHAGSAFSVDNLLQSTDSKSYNETPLAAAAEAETVPSNLNDVDEDDEMSSYLTMASFVTGGAAESK